MKGTPKIIELKDKWFLLEIFIFWKKYKIMPTLDYLRKQEGCEYASKDSIRRKFKLYDGIFFGQIGRRYFPLDRFFEEVLEIEEGVKNRYIQVPFNPVTFETIFDKKLNPGQPNNK